MGWRLSKADGYQTCPFDLMISNYRGVCMCIEDDFAKFTDPAYLSIRTADTHLHNIYYGFAFNHEYSDRGALHETEGWEHGKTHFIQNNYQRFIERYNRRIENFRNYLASGAHINFILSYYNRVPHELVDILRTRHPQLSFTIHCDPQLPQQFLSICQNDEERTRAVMRSEFAPCKELFPDLYNVWDEPFNEEVLLDDTNPYIRFIRFLP